MWLFLCEFENVDVFTSPLVYIFQLHENIILRKNMHNITDQKISTEQICYTVLSEYNVDSQQKQKVGSI